MPKKKSPLKFGSMLPQCAALCEPVNEQTVAYLCGDRAPYSKEKKGSSAVSELCSVL